MQRRAHPVDEPRRILRTFHPGVTEIFSNYLLPADDGDEPDGEIRITIEPGDDYEIDATAATDAFTVVDTDPTARTFHRLRHRG